MWAIYGSCRAAFGLNTSEMDVATQRLCSCAGSRHNVQQLVVSFSLAMKVQQNEASCHKKTKG